MAGLAPLIAAAEAGAIEAGAIRALFDVAYARWWLNATVDRDDVLRGFVSAEHEKRIADFRSLDDRSVELTRAYVRAALCGNLPDRNDVARNSVAQLRGRSARTWIAARKAEWFPGR